MRPLRPSTACNFSAPSSTSRTFVRRRRPFLSADTTAAWVEPVRVRGIFVFECVGGEGRHVGEIKRIYTEKILNSR